MMASSGKTPAPIPFDEEPELDLRCLRLDDDEPFVLAATVKFHTIQPPNRNLTQRKNYFCFKIRAFKNCLNNKF